MKTIMNGSWISAGSCAANAVPVFRKRFGCRAVSRASLVITALGVYEASINGRRVGDFILAPGWTDYTNRLQVQRYNVTGMLSKSNEMTILLGPGWYASRLQGKKADPESAPCAILAALTIEYTDGGYEEIVSDSTWEWTESEILFSSIYDGEKVDARRIQGVWKPVTLPAIAKDILIEQEGEVVTEQETIAPVQLMTTPKGEKVIDFGQNLTGYVQFTVRGKAGDQVTVRHAEVLDADGNFYTENMRSAKAEFSCILSGPENSFKPRFTYFGFRYIQLVDWPQAPRLEDFTAIVVHSDIKRTGSFLCGSELVNQLYHNIVWGQKGNFLDVPTDCPQRDERLGWTGDAQAFIRTACYNYDVHCFFVKWLHDLKSEQFTDGGVPAVIPNTMSKGNRLNDPNGCDSSAAWGDAACICPWQLYLSYGDKTILAEQYASMRAWVDFIRAQGEDEALWNTGRHYGDWLGLDAPYGSYKGSTDEGLIATAMYVNSTNLLIKAGEVLGHDMSEYKALHARIVSAFRKIYMPGKSFRHPTQTAYVLALHFGLCEDSAATAAELADMIMKNGTHLQTGFVGTPYLLHVLSGNGYTDLAYSLLLQTSLPSWLYPVLKGATTIWEHWDGIREDGTMWSANMNSFNHYAYGAVGDWLYGVAAGIKPVESAPGYARVSIAPKPDPRLGFMDASIETRFGKIRSAWKYEKETVRYEIEIPDNVTADVVTDGVPREYGSGKHIF